MGKINLNPIKRFLTGKNKGGKFFYGLIGLAGAGIGADTIGMSDIQTWISLVGVVIVFLIGLFVDNPLMRERYESFADDLAEELVKATDSKSDGGDKITKGEAKSIVLSIIKKHLIKQ
ncbi:MAG: hypothetical protein RIE52_11885 [Balneola sp.]